jgi:hypothetical protein
MDDPTYMGPTKEERNAMTAALAVADAEKRIRARLGASFTLSAEAGEEIARVVLRELKREAES